LEAEHKSVLRALAKTQGTLFHCAEFASLEESFARKQTVSVDARQTGEDGFIISSASGTAPTLTFKAGESSSQLALMLLLGSAGRRTFGRQNQRP